MPEEILRSRVPLADGPGGVDHDHCMASHEPALSKSEPCLA
jgi:hypothetical protein